MAPMGRKESSAVEFMKIHAAYCTLSDPEKRVSFRPQRLLTTTSSQFSGYSGRNWETASVGSELTRPSETTLQ
ncbi:Chaperone protein dnaJ 11 [Spatholobus suberectus]|nr:Chaperone protein dnaJ 11 [Spatholobus suberectus]